MSRRILHMVGATENPELDELSQLYARGCLEALSGHDDAEHHVLHISPDGSWALPGTLSPAVLARAPRQTPVQALAAVAALEVDLMVPHMFCRAGMTHYRALFDVLGIPYLGNAPAAMAIGADKALTRAIAGAAGVAVPDGELLEPGVEPTLEPPVVVKPAVADNSDGVSLVRDGTDYPGALSAAREHADRVLVERFIAPGREVRCGVLERDGELMVLPCEEYPVDPVTAPIRTGADKLGRDGDGKLRLEAKGAGRAWIVDPADPVLDAVAAATRLAHTALGCRDYSLFDFRIDPEGRPRLLEAGLYCSFSPQSVLATMARAAGIDVPELFTSVVTEALGRRRSA